MCPAHPQASCKDQAKEAAHSQLGYNTHWALEEYSSVESDQLVEPLSSRAGGLGGKGGGRGGGKDAEASTVKPESLNSVQDTDITYHCILNWIRVSGFIHQLRWLLTRESQNSTSRESMLGQCWMWTSLH